jgi:hypothetical protein
MKSQGKLPILRLKRFQMDLGTTIDAKDAKTFELAELRVNISFKILLNLSQVSLF